MQPPALVANAINFHDHIELDIIEKSIMTNKSIYLFCWLLFKNNKVINYFS